MEKVREIIEVNRINYSEFTYYLNIIDKIEQNVQLMPDIAIESCKSLIEGISKTILNKLGVAYSETSRGVDTPYTLFKKAVTELKKYSDIDTDFLQPASGMITRMTDIRNKLGDISHGRSSPKVVQSDEELATMIAITTDGVMSYVLGKYCGATLPDVRLIEYKDNPEFNSYLDESQETEGITYSKALYDQDPNSYLEQLNNYLSDKEGENT